MYLPAATLDEPQVDTMFFDCFFYIAGIPVD